MSIEKLEDLLSEVGQDLGDFISFYQSEIIQGDDANLQVEIESSVYTEKTRWYRDGDEYYEVEDTVTEKDGAFICVHEINSERFKEYIDDYQDEDYLSLRDRIESFRFYEIEVFCVNADGGLTNTHSYTSYDVDDVKEILFAEITNAGEAVKEDDEVEVNVWISDADENLESIFEDVKMKAKKYEKEMD